MVFFAEYNEFPLTSSLCSMGSKGNDEFPLTSSLYLNIAMSSIRNRGSDLDDSILGFGKSGTKGCT